MSLTSHLDDPLSPVTQFLKKRFQFKRSPVSDIHRALACANTILPREAIGYPWAVVGTAMDFRLRGYWQSVQFTSQPAAGAEAVCGADRGRHLKLRAVADLLNKQAAGLCSVGRRLDRRSEEWLARYCLVLSYFEVVYRSGHIPREIQDVKPDPNSPETMLAIPSQVAVDDLCAMSWAFFDSNAELLAKPVVLNPTFDGSDDVGGADADLIIDGCLCEIKTYKSPRSSKLSDTLYQLLGYVLLDYSNRYQIHDVGIYFSRQSTMVRWTLADLLETMAGSASSSLAECRSAFAIETAKARQALERSF